jgi:hypothetical protein
LGKSIRFVRHADNVSDNLRSTPAFALSPNAKLVLMGGAGAHTLLDLRGATDVKPAPYP